MRKYLVGAVLVAMFLGCAAARAADDAYTIKLHRVAKAGDVYDAHQTYEETKTTTVTGQGAPPPTSETHKTDLQGRVVVGDVDDNGEAKTLTITIKKFVDGGGKDLVEAGKVLQVKRGETDVTFSIQGGDDLSVDASAALLESFFTYPFRWG